MRGLRAVLYIAVLLCVAQFASADCGANGNLIDTAGPGQCVCLSGFSDPNCGTAAPAACAAQMTVANPTQADHFPTLDLSANGAAYTQNTLRVSLLSPYVQSRRYNSIIFVNQNSSSCSLGFADSFWSTNFTSGCQDEFHLDMPWIFHADCGFTIQTTVNNSTYDLQNEDNQTAIAENHYVSFAAKFTLNYTDVLGSIEGFNLTRNTAVPYKIYVQFPTQLDVSLSNVQIQSVVDVGFALTGDSFDPDTRILTIEMTIINVWPNMMDFTGEFWNVNVPNGVTHITDGEDAATYGVGLLSDQGSDCANSASTQPLCKQVFRLQFSTVNCTYDGTYGFQIGLFTCRDSVFTSCTTLQWNLNFTMETSSICSSVSTNLTLTGHLAPYLSMSATPADPTLPFYNPATNGFTIGSYGYFQVVLDDMQGNTVDLVFYEISFQANGYTNKNYLMKNGLNVTSDTLPANGNNDSSDYFHYNEAKLTVWNDIKAFSVYFSSVVFKVLPSSVTTYTFRASADATYLGNAGETKKRSIEFVWDAPAVPDQSVSTFAKVGLRTPGTPVFGQSNIKSSESQATSSNLAYIIGGGGAGLVLIVLAVIGLAIHHKKRQVAKALAQATRA